MKPLRPTEVEQKCKKEIQSYNRSRAPSAREHKDFKFFIACIGGCRIKFVHFLNHFLSVHSYCIKLFTMCRFGFAIVDHVLLSVLGSIYLLIDS